MQLQLEVSDLNLLGLFLRGLLARRLTEPAVVRRLRGAPFVLGLRCAGMELAIALSGDAVQLTSRLPARVDTLVEGELPALVALLRGRLPVGALLRGGVSVRGDLKLLWRVLPALRA